MTDLMVKPEPRGRSIRRRRRRTRKIVARVLLVAVLGAAAAGGTLFAVNTLDSSDTPAAGVPEDGEQLTVLLATTRASDPSQQAESLTLFGVDRSGADPIALFLPVGTFGQIPGQDSVERIGKASIFGRESLQQTTVENLLGIVIDRTVMLDDVALARIVEDLGGVEIEVTERIYEQTDAGRELVFPIGSTTMQGPQAVTYLTYRGEGETELDRFVRAQRFWEGVLAAADPESLPETLVSAGSMAQADAEAFGELLGAFSETSGGGAFDVLAVESVGANGVEDVYEPDEAAIGSQMERAFAGSLAPLALERDVRPRVELRNGVGVPEVGGTAAALLVPEGFKIEVTGNTAEFGNSSTRIVVYGDDEASLDLAQRARDLLGVGEIEVGTRGQTVVDLTIVIGRDFVGKA